MNDEVKINISDTENLSIAIKELRADLNNTKSLVNEIMNQTIRDRKIEKEKQKKIVEEAEKERLISKTLRTMNLTEQHHLGRQIIEIVTS